MHEANPNTLWSDHSPLSLAIACGNDLVDKMPEAGADVLAPVTLQERKRKAVGTVVDFAYYKYYQISLTFLPWKKQCS
ncbi:UNVERIFIED_CONTAM: hypothetical protein H355_005534, partial [Colinus virginianus]